MVQFKEQTEKLKELAKATVQSGSFETLLKQYSELKAAGQPFNIIPIEIEEEKVAEEEKEEGEEEAE